ncbi:FAD-binding and (Fe-S)-binding domain-containing protein [Mycobacterium noviomagense]|uniref:Dimethylmenaquinone methyltransferase n=1 Tax=Mycobacterium noviomagense TaxID=459858 RepID=A0A7I7PI64_9MYCO|nr:FAD-binding and (Fe-S)-binding domain-containing protein [Mycobacterium noviomagense]ORB16839.1 FAD-binding oxidoreductase [Mycobacterium noviomagense]BBY08190.1 dimethylmenaquinone methyltransferase [Mycobacterium noviomagense]
MSLRVNGRTQTIPARPDTRFTAGMATIDKVNVAGLEGQLRRNVSGEVRFDTATKAMYANDASNFRQVPIGVVVPKTLDDIVETVRACHAYHAPVLCRGGGTSLSGETVNVAVVIDFSKYLTEIVDIDADRRLATVQTGVINEQLNRATGEYGLVFGPDPSSHSRCTLGGNIGNNSCGVHSIQSHLYGPGPRTSDNTHALEVITYDGARFWVGNNEEERLDAIIAEGGRKGEIYAALRDLRDEYADDIRGGFPSVDELPRRVSGYNLDELLPEKGFNVARALVGTESTCAVALTATVMLTPAMAHRTLVVIQYDTLGEAGDAVPDIMAWKPIGLEAVDHMLVHDQELTGSNAAGRAALPRPKSTGAWLFVQFGSDEPGESYGRAGDFVGWLRKKKKYDDDRIVLARSKQDGGNSDELWSIREAGLGSTAFPKDSGDHWPGWEDSAVPPHRVGDYVRDLQRLYADHGLRGAMYGHLGEGCIHSRINFDLRHHDGLVTYRRFMEAAGDLVASYGGSMSGEHGDGQQRAELLGKQYGPRLLEAMRRFKLIWDPEWKMNPGKVIDAYRFDENLKLGPNYNPPRPKVKFAYEEDDGDFAHAALRCVGVGKCRVPQAEMTMCPSYQVTREEKHSTRGRARLLFEMLRGEVITDGWQSNEVADALDLCLACKGCTSDCPVNVDIPTYKAEFLYHHFRSLRRWRPRYAYAFGFIDQAARLASAMPELANFATQTPVVSRIAKALGGIDRRRPLPTFAPMTLQQWFANRPVVNAGGPRVVLLPDTFNNRLHTDVGVACVEALEAAGWQVVMPQGHICCGRPLYDYGFLDVAERYLHHVMSRLRSEIRAGTPIVGMEPSCLAVFKDELGKLLPHDDDADRLARNSYHFAEFLDKFDVELPSASGARALLWGHCHQRATGGVDADQQILERMGVDVEPISGGCCGLAGSWGFEEGKYQLSLDCGEQALLPAIRKNPDAVVVANGFSCQTQITDAGAASPLHLAQVMAMARESADIRSAGPPSRPEPETRVRATRVAVPIAAIGAAAAGASWALWSARR